MAWDSRTVSCAICALLRGAVMERYKNASFLWKQIWNILCDDFLYVSQPTAQRSKRVPSRLQWVFIQPFFFDSSEVRYDCPFSRLPFNGVSSVMSVLSSRRLVETMKPWSREQRPSVWRRVSMPWTLYYSSLKPSCHQWWLLTRVVPLKVLM